MVSLRDLLRDLRHAARSLVRSPGHAAVVVATLAVGVGAATAVVAVVREAILRPLPFREPDRLVRVWDRAPDGMIAPMSPIVWRALRARTDVFETVGGSSDSMFTLTGHGDPELLVGYRFSADFFPMLGREPLLGRVFAAGEDRTGAEPVVVLSHRLWTRKFGSDPAVVGRPITLSGISWTVIGVMSAGFVHPKGIELWTPFDLPEALRDNPRARFVRVVARLREGRTLADARRAVADVQKQLETARPDALRGGGLVARGLDEDDRGDARTPLLALLGAVGFVLLAACANLAGLALARAAARRRELAVRVALGAGRARLLRESLAEWVLLAAAGAGGALLVASWIARALPGLFPATIANLSLPKVESVPVDGPVAAFAVAAALVVVLVAAIVPAAHALSIDAGEALKGAGRGVVAGGGRTLKLLVAAEVAVALVLLVGAGLLVRTFLHLREGGLGFDPEHVLSARMILDESRYPEPAKTMAFHDAVLRRVRALPGVESAGVVAFLPLSGWHGPRPVRFEGEAPVEPGKEREVEVQWMGVGYRDTMRIPLLAGRDVEERDGQGSPPVVLVNAAFVRRYLPGGPASALGRRLAYGLRSPQGEEPRLREIVGVIGDVKHLGFDHAADPAVYVPYAQEPIPLLSLTVRTSGDPAAFGPALQRAVWAEDPQQPVGWLMPLADLAAESLALRRLSALLAGSFALAALGLAALGAYGVVAQVVGNGTRAIGVRLALGASSASVVRGVLQESLSAAAMGAVAGLVVAVGVGRLLRSLLVGVGPLDPFTLVLAALALVGAAGLAAWLPARRAALVDPAAVLRQE
ncbi:MAG TPA: ADOP family duplicated permease [Vicinamibacteria bacterium]|nr:ADOP family duplicated permease [Vicinamibacteria bacterium]